MGLRLDGLLPTPISRAGTLKMDACTFDSVPINIFSICPAYRRSALLVKVGRHRQIGHGFQPRLCKHERLNPYFRMPLPSTHFLSSRPTYLTQLRTSPCVVRAPLHSSRSSSPVHSHPLLLPLYVPDIKPAIGLSVPNQTPYALPPASCPHSSNSYSMSHIAVPNHPSMAGRETSNRPIVLEVTWVRWKAGKIRMPIFVAWLVVEASASIVMQA